MLHIYLYLSHCFERWTIYATHYIQKFVNHLNNESYLNMHYVPLVWNNNEKR